jgi:hypothetical protein
VASVNTNPLEINLVLNVRHENEGCDDTLALRCAQLGADLAVPYVVCGCEQCADCALGHCQESRLLSAAGVGVDRGCALRLPVDLGGIAEVLVDALDIVERVERVGARFAGRAGYARVEGVGHERVTTAEAEGADTTVAIYCNSLAAHSNNIVADYAREQQGVSWGQWLSFVHFAPARAEPTRVAAAKAAEMACGTIVGVWFSRRGDVV